MNKLIILGNGFDLAHGLKTSYKNFLDWYMCKAFDQFCDNKAINYVDPLIEIQRPFNGMNSQWNDSAKSFEDVLMMIGSSGYQKLIYSSNFFKRLLTTYQANNWVDIERYYFRLLKSYFSNTNLNGAEIIVKMNQEFDYLINQLSNYIEIINKEIPHVSNLFNKNSEDAFSKIFKSVGHYQQSKFLNFNYTDTLQLKGYAPEEDIIHIHGRVTDVNTNPIIFGYGDESDPIYQQIEDSGSNIYLEHIKSFSYFKTSNYHKLLSYLDSGTFAVYIVGHSCGLSDRVLLNTIFEHGNCERIEIFYHVKEDGSDNFKEITQEISRHFKPANKGAMRKKIVYKSPENKIPQN